MDINDPRFEEYQTRFEALAEQVEDGKSGPQPEIGSAKYFLCLYGENGLPPEEEFELLQTLKEHLEDGLQKTTIQTSQWEDIILYLPR